jgi:hypothetical protein
MPKTLIAAIALSFALSACGGFRESRFNPFNWFGRSESRASSQAEDFLPRTDPRPFVEAVTELAIEPIPGGAILRARGLPPTQGFWAAELVAYEGSAENPVPPGTLIFDFRLAPPPVALRQGQPQSREIDVAIYLTDNQLAEIGTIVVRGQRTERVIRR